MTEIASVIDLKSLSLSTHTHTHTHKAHKGFVWVS